MAVAKRTARLLPQCLLLLLLLLLPRRRRRSSELLSPFFDETFFPPFPDISIIPRPGFPRAVVFPCVLLQCVLLLCVLVVVVFQTIPTNRVCSPPLGNYVPYRTLPRRPGRAPPRQYSHLLDLTFFTQAGRKRSRCSITGVGGRRVVRAQPTARSAACRPLKGCPRFYRGGSTFSLGHFGPGVKIVLGCGTPFL